MNGDYLDYLAHYRTPGSKNGISTTEGYDAIGKIAMTPEQRREKYKQARQKLASRFTVRRTAKTTLPGSKPSSFLERRKQQDQLRFEKWKIKNAQRREDKQAKDAKRQEKQDARAAEKQRRKEARKNEPTWKKIGKGAAIGGAILGTAALVDLAARGEKSVIGQIGKTVARGKNDREYRQQMKRIEFLFSKRDKVNGMTKVQMVAKLMERNSWNTDADIQKAARRANAIRQNGLEFVEAAVKLKDDVRRAARGY